MNKHKAGQNKQWALSMLMFSLSYLYWTQVPIKTVSFIQNNIRDYFLKPLEIREGMIAEKNS